MIRLTLDWLRSVARQSPGLRRMWRDLNVLHQAYIRGFPDWARWRVLSVITQTNPPGDNPSERPLRLVYISNKITARELKIARAAKLFDHQVVLVTGNSNSADTSFDSIRIAENPWHILRVINDLRPDVIHAFIHEDNLWMLPILSRAPAPIVYDPYDCLHGMLTPDYQYSRRQLRAERRWFAESAHICARSLEPRYLRRHLGYRLPSTTYFPEYCWQVPSQRKPRHLQEDTELNIVYCGGIWPEDRYSAAAAGYAQYLEIGRVLAKQRIHLHLYPAPPPAGATHESFFSAYLQEQFRNPFFHIYPTLPYEELMRELPRYDAALHILGASINTLLGSSTPAKKDCSSANKLFDYIEAGLPVIIHDGRHQRGVVRHYGVSIEVTDIGQARQALMHVLSVGYPGKPSAAITFHAHRLDAMYRGLIR
jgi:hypothetical protein